MYKKILVPLDGSNFSEQVLAYLPALSSQSSELLLLSVIGPEIYTYAHEPAIAYQNLRETLENDRKSYLQKKANQLQSQGWKVSTELHFGDPLSSISFIANKEHAELVAMTTHGRAGLGRMFLGSVADRVVRTVVQPVFLARPSEQKGEQKIDPLKSEKTPYKVRRILVPLDGSPLAEKALSHAEKIAKEQAASLILVRAVLPPLAGERELYFANEQTIQNLQQQMINLSAQYLERVQLRLKLAGIDATCCSEIGPAAEVIYSIAVEHQADLIVMSTHGRSGVNRWVNGSVANQVLHSTTCPILLVRGLQTEQNEEVAKAGIMLPDAVLL